MIHFYIFAEFNFAVQRFAHFCGIFFKKQLGVLQNLFRRKKKHETVKISKNKVTAWIKLAGGLSFIIAKTYYILLFSHTTCDDTIMQAPTACKFIKISFPFINVKTTVVNLI